MRSHTQGMALNSDRVAKNLCSSAVDARRQWWGEPIQQGHDVFQIMASHEIAITATKKGLQFGSEEVGR